MAKNDFIENEKLKGYIEKNQNDNIIEFAMQKAWKDLFLMGIKNIKKITQTEKKNNLLYNMKEKFEDYFNESKGITIEGFKEKHDNICMPIA